MYFQRGKIQGVFVKKKNIFSNRCCFRISLNFALTQASIEIQEKWCVLYCAQSAHFYYPKARFSMLYGID